MGMSTNIRVDQTPTGWVAYQPGMVLAARASTKEEAVARYESAFLLVKQLAAKADAKRSPTSPSA